MIRAYISREFVQLHISSCARRYFYCLFDVFFFCSYILSMFVRAEIQSAPVFVRSEIQSATLFAHSWRCSSSSWRRAALLSVTAFVTLTAPPIRIQAHPTLAETVTHRLVSLLEIFTFSSPFFSSSSSSVSCRSWSWLSSLSRWQLRRFSRSELNLSRCHVLALYWRVPCPPRVYR